MRVLVVDDDDVAREALAATVRELGHAVATAGDGVEALELLAREPVDAILSDLRMPHLDGVELCRRVRATATRYTYFVFVTGADDKEHFILGMDAGADDYQAKPVDVDELRARLRSAERVLAAYRALEAKYDELRHDSARWFHDARTDALTTLPNRRSFDEDLGAVHANVRRYGQRACLALCDIDDFKRFNDVHGHLFGDDVLRRTAATIRDRIRAGDTAYRYGGEEFAVLLPHQGPLDATRAMDRVRAEVERLGGPTLSVGIADASGAADTAEWIARADTALYAAKRQGKNRVEIVAGPTEGDAPRARHG